MSVTKDQLKETAERLFTDIDTNNNGKLEKDEVREFSKAMMKVIKPDKTDFDEEKFEDNFKKLDKNADGTVCKEELFESLYEKAKEAGALAEEK